MTTARDFLDIVPVLDALAVQAGDLPAPYLTCHEAGTVSFSLESRDDAIAWGQFLGFYQEQAMGDGRLFHEGSGTIAGHKVTAFYVGTPS